MGKVALVTFLYFWSFQLLGQAVHPYSVDAIQLENSLFNAINATRSTHGLNELQLDLNLRNAAKTQAEFCVRNSRLTHTNSIGRLKNVENRVSSLNIEATAVGENIALYPLGTFYHFTADSITRGWMNSEGHRNNLLNSIYTHTGIAVSFDKDGKAYVVQVFASGSDLVSSALPKSDTLREKLPFRLKKYEPDYAAIINIQNSAFASGGYLMTSSFAPNAKKVFKGPYDGIVFERVSGSQVSTDSLIYYSSYNRRNNNSSVNGELFYPHYTKELMEKKNFKITENEFNREKNRLVKQIQLQLNKLTREIGKTKRFVSRYKNSKDSVELKAVEQARYDLKELVERQKALKKDQDEIKRRKWNPMYWEFDFSSDVIYSPETLSEVNILFFKNNQLIYPMYYHVIKYTGEYMDSIAPKRIEWEFDKPVIAVHKIPVKKKLKLLYDQSAYELQKTNLDYLDKNLKDIEIRYAQVKVFASVEGTLENNTFLFKQREKEIEKALKPYLGPDAIIFYDSKENWAKFYQQIKEDTNYTFLRKQPKDSIRAYLKVEELNKPWIDYLQDQRIALINIHGGVMVKDTLSYLLDRYGKKDNYSIQQIQSYLIDQILKGQMSPTYIDRLPAYKKQPGLSKVVLNKYMLKYTLGQKDTSFNYNSFLKNFAQEIYAKGATDTLLLTYINLFAMHSDFNPHAIAQASDIMFHLFGRGFSNKSMAVYGLHAMEHYYPFVSGREKKYNSSYYGYQNYHSTLPYAVFNFYSRDVAFRIKRVNWESLILFFCKHKQYGLASALVSQYINENGYDPDFRFIQLVIQYVHPEIDSGVFAEELMTELPKLGKKRWCSYFYGEFSPSFQVLDYQPLWKLYCQTCN
jgi:uncharacterized protein YkwD